VIFPVGAKNTPELAALPNGSSLSAFHRPAGHGGDLAQLNNQVTCTRFDMDERKGFLSTPRTG
jgi:hypothetical protein